MIRQPAVEKITAVAQVSRHDADIGAASLTRMIEWKLFVRPGVVISVIGHIAALLLGLLFAGANPFESRPAEAIAVDIVTPDEAPQFGGDPGTMTAPAVESAPPAPTPPPASQPPSAGPSRSARQVPIPPQIAEPMRPPGPPPTLPQPHDEQEADQPNAGDMFALPLALPDGRLGGGFDAPAIDTAKIAHDETTAFRDHLKSCATLPAGIDPADKIKIVLRISFKRDGTLAAQPQLIEASASPKGPVLMQSAISALRQCQPYTMLPADRYKEWKVLDLSFTPENLSGG